ncbi:MAG: transposase [Gammaproteobacteria bacterium]|nr:transposase [Gammaproteobacteria bacterium]
MTIYMCNQDIHFFVMNYGSEPGCSMLTEWRCRLQPIAVKNRLADLALNGSLFVTESVSGQAHPSVCDDTKQSAIQPPSGDAVLPGTAINSDESLCYEHMSETGRAHVTASHSAKERKDGNGTGRDTRRS